MTKVKILANSMSDLLPDFAAQFGIDLIPDIIVYGNKSYRQNIDITVEQFYEVIDSLDKLPTTSPPSIEEYKEHIRKFEDYEAVIILEVSSKISSSYDTLCIAVAELEQDGFKARVIPYDSYLMSWGLGFMAIEAAKLANEGKNADEITTFLDDLKINNHIGVYMVLKSLNNFRRSGRVQAVRAFAADIFGIKPIISMPNGVIKDIKLSRGFEKGLNDIVSYYVERGKKGGDIYVAHAANIEDAELMKKKLQQVDPDAKIHIKWVGSAFGVHIGRGAIGIAVMEQ